MKYGNYSLTIDNSPVLSDSTRDWAEFRTLAEARDAARMLCGAAIIRWERTDSGAGMSSHVVERVPSPPLVEGELDFDLAPGRYGVPGATLEEFGRMCAARGLRTSVAYRYSGPSLMVASREGLRELSLRVFDDRSAAWFTVRQRPA